MRHCVFHARSGPSPQRSARQSSGRSGAARRAARLVREDPGARTRSAGARCERRDLPAARRLRRVCRPCACRTILAHSSSPMSGNGAAHERPRLPNRDDGQRHDRSGCGRDRDGHRRFSIACTLRDAGIARRARARSLRGRTPAVGSRHGARASRRCRTHGARRPVDAASAGPHRAGCRDLASRDPASRTACSLRRGAGHRAPRENRRRGSGLRAPRRLACGHSRPVPSAARAYPQSRRGRHRLANAVRRRAQRRVAVLAGVAHRRKKMLSASSARHLRRTSLSRASAKRPDRARRRAPGKRFVPAGTVRGRNRCG